jgi:pimeloyl-ACP methyl ester carboxylesterase
MKSKKILKSLSIVLQLLVLAPIFALDFASPLPQKTIFSHGFEASYRQARYYQSCCGDSSLIYAFNFPEVDNKNNANIGQDKDIAALDTAYLQIMAGDQQAPVMIGVSRGASVCLTWLGKKNRPVAALVLESPFAKIQDIINGKINSFPIVNWIPLASRLVHHLIFPFVVAWSYSPAGPHPLDNMATIPVDTPIFIYCSKEDALIPAYSTMKLYKKLVELGHTKTHIFIVDNGPHASILWGSDGQRCKNAIHAFYSRYGLAHNPELALNGQVDFATTQPTLDEITAQMPAASWLNRIDHN